jgi:GAF domain-containing protein
MVASRDASDGSRTWLLTRFPTNADGMPQTSLDLRRLSTTARLGLLQEIAARLADSRGVNEVVASIREALKTGLGVDAFVLNVATENSSSLLTLSASGTSTETAQFLQNPVPLDERVPASAVISSGEPIYWVSLDERDRSFPQLAAFPSHCRSWAILPLAVHGTTFGVLSLGWRVQSRFDEIASAFLMVIAQQCAVAVDRAQIEESERAERETLELMSEGTRLMVSELNPQVVVRRLVQLAVPRLAPWCAVYVAEEASLRRVAIEVADDGALSETLHGLEAVPIDSHASPARCFRSGRAEVGSSKTETHVRQIDDEVQTPHKLSGELPWTALALPIRAGGQTIGVMSLVSHLWGGAPPAGILHAAEGLAGRAGVALMNARRYDVEHTTANLLTETLLPGVLPRVPGYEVAARFVPADGRVAGDWFDVLPLPWGPFLFGVGDVGGHGIRAAALMTQLRNAARGLALAGSSPGRILHGLAQLTRIDAAQGFATSLYGLLEPDEGLVRWSSAGHLPPLAFDDGNARWLELADHPPFGLPARSAPAERTLSLAFGDGFLLVTDGVVERRGVHIDNGLEKLRVFVAARAALGARGLVSAIVADFCRAPTDDCCVVVIRRA